MRSSPRPSRTTRFRLSAKRRPDIKKLALQYPVNAYGPDKLDDPTQAEPIVQRMMQLDPSNTENYFALAKIYEDAGTSTRRRPC